MFDVDNYYLNKYYIAIGDNINNDFYFDPNCQKSGATSVIFSSKKVKIQFPVSGFGEIIFALKNEIDPWTINFNLFVKNNDE